MDNKIFIKALKKKEKKALDYLIDKYSDLIFKVSYGILKNRELSEENVNDVILKVWNNSNSFNREADKFTVWLIVITKYSAIDILRKEEKHSYKEDIGCVELKEKNLLEDKFIENESLTAIKEEIENMSYLDKEIFIRKFFKEETTKEIGKNLGINENIINLRIFRGRKKLKEKLLFKGL